MVPFDRRLWDMILMANDIFLPLNKDVLDCMRSQGFLYLSNVAVDVGWREETNRILFPDKMK